MTDPSLGGRRRPSLVRRRAGERIEIRPTGSLLIIIAVWVLLGPAVAAQGTQPVPSRTDNARSWTVRCVTEGGRAYVDTTFTGRVYPQDGTLIWQVARVKQTRFDVGPGAFPNFGRRNFATGQCVAIARPAGTDLEVPLRRPSPPPRLRPGSTAIRPDSARGPDPRTTVPRSVLPDSLYRRADSTERMPPPLPSGDRP
jgi:hypothetical protein